MVKSRVGTGQTKTGKVLLSSIFHALSDPTRRKILERLLGESLTVSEIKKPYKMSLVAISKHLKVLSQAKLVRSQKVGREHVISIHSQTLKEAYHYLELFKKDWSKQLDALQKFMEKNS